MSDTAANDPIAKKWGLSRDVPVVPGQTALLFIDVQNYVMPGGGEYAGLDPAEVEACYGYFFREMETRGLPNMRRLQAACRERGIEVLYTVIESLTQDGRDMSLDYKISGLFCPKGSRDAQVVEATRSSSARPPPRSSSRRTCIMFWAISASAF
jgi:ureidoacrylate peracid hydrolase